MNVAPPVIERPVAPTGRSVKEFLGTIQDEQVRKDCEALVGIMQKATKAPPEMWGLSDIHVPTLKKLVTASVKHLAATQARQS